MIPNTNEISLYLHCRQCIEQKPYDVSPQEWGRIEVGFTKIGLQVWCKRHHINVVHIDFQGQQHPANLTGANDGNGKVRK